VCSSVDSKYHGANEEQITFLLQSELGAVLDDANGRGLFGRSFLADLERCLPQIHWHSIDLRFAHGLVGTVRFHSRHHEGTVSSSDMVLLIRRPSATCSQSPNGELVISEGEVRALFGQAKLGRPGRDGVTHWGKLTSNQRLRFPTMLDFMTLLLYRWRDIDGSGLAPITWQPCRAHTSEDVESWLAHDAFPSQIGSEAVVQGVTLGDFGTADQRVIDELVDDRGARPWNVLEIRLSWPPGDFPATGIRLTIPHEAPRVVVLRY